MDTEFAPLEISDKTEIENQRSIAMDDATILAILESIQNIVMILNENRQIIYYNKNLLNLTTKNEEEIIGERIGNVLNCIYAQNTKSGCGTTKFCSQCGAVKSVLKAQKGIKNLDECRILINNDKSINAINLQVKAVPITIKNHIFTLFSIEDISDKKQKEIIERIFFHDILNTAGGIEGLSEILKIDLKKESTINNNEIIINSELINDFSSFLVQDIITQRDLTLAEKNELPCNPRDFDIKDFIFKQARLFSKMATEREITINADVKSLSVTTDPVILERIIGNMIKNAIEASERGSAITIENSIHKDYFEVSIHNPSYIPENVQLQIFQRSFSTKGKGRGIGTYSMKLLAENILKGKITFKSEPEAGTLFKVQIPLKHSS